MRCGFCKATNATVRACFWPILAMRNTLVADLVPGNVVQTSWYQIGKDDRRYRRDGGCVMSITPATHGILKIEVCANKPSPNFDTDTFVFGWHESANVFALGPAPCGRPACELHHIERGPKHHICLDHWNAWEKGAAA